VLLVHDVDALPEVFLHLVRCQVVELNVVPEALIGTERVHELPPHVESLLTAVEKDSQLVLVESALGSFFEEVRRDHTSFHTACSSQHLLD